MPELDHLIFASPDLGKGIDHIESLTGVRAAMGGPHPGMGTRNALLTFDDVTYFEIISIDPDQPEPAAGRPFGLAIDSPMRLAGFAVHPAQDESLDDVVALMRSAGHDPGDVASMSRIRPDGVELHWRLTVAHRSAEGPDPLLPFVIDWGTTPSPATTTASMGRLTSFAVGSAQPVTRAVIEALGIGAEIVDEPAGLWAQVALASGETITIT